MAHYSLYHLLMFFKHQQDTKFEVINQIVGIVESNLLSDSEKRELILELLHDTGMVNLDETENDATDDSSEQIEELPEPVDLYQIEILNGIVEFELNMN